MYAVLGLFQQNFDLVIKIIKQKHLNLSGIDEKYIFNLIAERAEYKKNKDYNKANEMRNKLLEKRIIIKDVGNSTEWDIII